MAEDSSQEKTHEPSQKRLDDAREKGQVTRSRELSTVVSLLGSAACLWVFSKPMLEGMMNVFYFTFTPTKEQLFDEGAMLMMLVASIQTAGLAILPFCLSMVILGIVSYVIVGGWNFSIQALEPKLEKLDPIKGIKRILGKQGLMELVKSIAKVGLVGAVGYGLLVAFWEQLFQLATLPLGPALALAGQMFFWTFLLMSTSLIVVAAIDVPFQIYQMNEQLRMTEQELRDEMKETEGKPEVKGKIRQLQREFAQRRMMEDVPTADVVVTNPTHFAVALKYDQLSDHAPRIVAMGVDNVALKIREIAAFHDVMIYEEPPLARVLYHTGDIDKEIPTGLYLAVAQVLAYVYQVKRPQRNAPKPIRPISEIPEEFQQYADKGKPDA